MTAPPAGVTSGINKTEMCPKLPHCPKLPQVTGIMGTMNVGVLTKLSWFSRKLGIFNENWRNSDFVSVTYRTVLQLNNWRDVLYRSVTRHFYG